MKPPPRSSDIFGKVVYDNSPDPEVKYVSTEEFVALCNSLYKPDFFMVINLLETRCLVFLIVLAFLWFCIDPTSVKVYINTAADVDVFFLLFCRDRKYYFSKRLLYSQSTAQKFRSS